MRFKVSCTSRRLALIIAFGLPMGDQVFGGPQHGTAPNGYYPPNYAHDMFTGTVSKVDDSSREVTLTFTDAAHNKTESFVGVIDSNYMARWKDKTQHPLKPSDLPIGTKITVYYMAAQKKVDGKKVKIYTIFQIQEAPNVARGFFVFQAH